MMHINLDTIKHIHFVGIGGAGMSGIAEVLLNQGYGVSGSDINDSSVVAHLRSLGASIHLGHSENNIQGTDLVVISSAVNNQNPEILAAEASNIPVVPRAKMLAALMQKKYGIAISGTHGKTTTTSLVASVLAQAGVHPTFVIGGLLKSVGANAQLGKGQYFVAEADESDASFLYLRPKIAVITNIDEDHLSTYNNDMEELRVSFLKFVSHIPEDGLVVLCADDPVALSLLPKITAPVITYGFNEEADLIIRDFQQNGLQCHFTVTRKQDHSKTALVLNLAGKHNATNAVAALAIASKLNVSMPIVQEAFKNFLGIGRRFQTYGEFNISTTKVVLIDDYGHHPREIAATLAAIRLVWPGRRLVMAYQPHRYTRTQALMQDFATVLSSSDVLLLLDVYSAGEQPIEGADGQSLCEAISNYGRINPIFVPKIDKLPEEIEKVVQEGDILLLQGAGSIGSMAAKMVAMQQQNIRVE